MRDMVQTPGQLDIAAGPNDDARMQNDLRKAALLRRIEHRAFGIVAIAHHNDARIRAKMQIPELVAGGCRGDQQVLRIPPVRVAEKRHVR